ncbi:MAG: hypothetical protein IT579_08005 [Verrucomicrobia subdivision 3 bacterium]|nr:hypothetical protein [Limisphaerales bacterium]
MPDQTAQTKHWSGSGQLRGGASGIKFFLTVLRVLGLRFTYALLVPPAVYFSFVSPDVPATMDYHRRIFGPVPWWNRRWLVFRHFFAFGQAIIDRIAVLAGNTKHFSFTFDGEEHLRAAVAEGRGVLLLTAHIGNWEAAGQLLSRINVPINVTGFDNEDPAIRALLNQSAKANFRLLPLTGAPTDAIPLVAALRRGEIVAMMGDRAYDSPAANVPFFDGEAAFPVGAHVMAAIAGAPLVTVFSMREPGGHYHFFGFPPQPPERPPHHLRDAHLRACAATFARRLEGIVKRDPLQWYNFFPFWNAPGKRSVGTSPPSSIQHVPSALARPSSAPTGPT